MEGPPPLKGFSWLSGLGSGGEVCAAAAKLGSKVACGRGGRYGGALGGVWAMITMCVLMGATSSNHKEPGLLSGHTHTQGA